MKKYHLITLFITLISFQYKASESNKSNNNGTLRFVTYNLRRAGTEKNPKYLWENRKPLVFDLIAAINPDVIGFQEATQVQIDDLRTTMADYGFFGDSRNTHAQGWRQRLVIKHPQAQDEHNPIFYNKKRLSLIDNNTFGINPSGTFLPRICTWGLFEDNQTKKRFYVYNTHLTNTEKGLRSLIAARSSSARRKQIRLIREHIEKNTNQLPVILMGDFNTNLTGKKKPKRLAKTGLVNAKAIAQKIVGPQETRTGWNNSELKTIDHIFIKAKNAVIKLYEVIASPQNVFPSDHRPVLVDLQLK